jgi:hypothetical protein
MPGEMPLKEWLVDRHVFDADDPFGAFDLENPIDQQERIPVWNHIEDPTNVHGYVSDTLSGPNEPSGQRNVSPMARFRRDDVRLNPAAHEREIAK